MAKFKINPFTQSLDRVDDSTLDEDGNAIIDKAESLDDGAGNTATAANVKDAVTKKHTQGTDQGLDTGGANAVTATQAKAGYTHSTVSHAPSDAVALATVKADSDVADAISKKHSQNTDTKLDNGGANEVSASIIKKANIEFIIDGGGSAIATGIKGDIVIPYNCTITGVTLLADLSGNIVIDIWKDVYAQFAPTVADTITASAKPTLSGAIKYQDATLTGWTKSLSEGDILRINVDSCATITRCVLVLSVTKSAS